MRSSGAPGQSTAHRLFEKEPPLTLFVVAHPDDEVIAAAAALMHLREKSFVLHVTDGAPRNMADAARAGFATADAYAQTRRAESRAALAFTDGVTLLDGLGVPDQTASRTLIEITVALVDIIAGTAAELVVTHAFEGGHPDHDATAFAAAHAARACGVPLVEASGYFDDGTAMATGRFAQPELPAFVHTLDQNEQSTKRRMFACFATQTETLAAFGTAVEQYRPAPPYDFTKPPNHGRVLYDRYDWGLHSSEWPPLAGDAQHRLQPLLTRRTVARADRHHSPPRTPRTSRTLADPA